MTTKTEVMQMPAGEPPAIRTDEPGSDVAFIQMIERVSRSPDVRMDILQGLIAMRNDENLRIAERAFNEAMAAAQAEMGRVSTDAANPQTHSRYATYAALDRVLRPIYTRHGFALSFDTGESPASDMVRVLCYVSCGGFKRTYKADMPADGKGAKGGDVMTKTHATGSAFSYGARYLLKLIFNVAVGEADDDGNKAGAGETITEEQVKFLHAAVVEADANLPKFLAYLKIGKLEELPASRYPEALQALAARKRQATKAPA